VNSDEQWTTLPLVTTRTNTKDNTNNNNNNSNNNKTIKQTRNVDPTQ
jgi:hypothetical protein